MSSHDIPPWVVSDSEQVHTHATDTLSDLVCCLREDITERAANGVGDAPQSLFFMNTTYFINTMIDADRRMVAAMLSAALYRLAELPDPVDPLADLEKGFRK